VETMATRQQVLLRSFPKNARIHSKWGLFFKYIWWGVIQVPFVYWCCVCCLLVLILVLRGVATVPTLHYKLAKLLNYNHWWACFIIGSITNLEEFI
jgi:hypothetical protein